MDDQFAISFGVAFEWLSVARVIIGDAKRRRAKLNGSNAHLFFFFQFIVTCSSKINS